MRKHSWGGHIRKAFWKWIKNIIFYTSVGNIFFPSSPAVLPAEVLSSSANVLSKLRPRLSLGRQYFASRCLHLSLLTKTKQDSVNAELNPTFHLGRASRAPAAHTHSEQALCTCKGSWGVPASQHHTRDQVWTPGIMKCHGGTKGPTVLTLDFSRQRQLLTDGQFIHAESSSLKSLCS